MPFMGRDWRSPGEAWVKTESLGWQRMKIIESQLYLTACHQNHPACSWPPRSQYGQHMANNCNKQQVIYSCDRAGSETKGCHMIDTSDASCADITSSSNSSSGQSSAATSPTSSPDKNSNIHHIHPITISSPYGKYSTSCCAHHLVNHRISGETDPSSCAHLKTACHRNHGGIQHTDARCFSKGCALMSRSLSREMITHPPHPSSITNDIQRLRHNNSVSDFRNSNTADSSSIGTLVNQECRGKGCTDQLKAREYPSDASSQLVKPLLLKNGIQMDNEELLGGSEACLIDPSGKSATNSTNSERASDVHSNDEKITSVSPTALSPQSQDADQCCPCECCSCTNQHPTHPLIQDSRQPKTAPHCRISVRTREVAMHNTISEAFYRLDFYNAIHDIRRFNYISKLLHLLITQNLTSLSGCATKVLFTMLEQVAWEVSSNKRNIHVIRNLLHELKQTIQKYYCWGRPIGSSALWQQHFETIERISQIVDEIELSPPKSQITFDKLPVEMIREILLRLNDYRDLVNSARASPVMQTMIDNQNVWRKLCLYHFNDQQLKLAFEMSDFKFARRPTLRGIKYARTTSADGKSSYRNPVTHKQSTSTGTAARQQLEETSNRRGSVNQDSSNVNDPNRSHVTNAVRMFDRECSSSVAQGAQIQPLENQQPQGLEDGNRVAERSALDVDWERVFHQLRKRFDLKEEYADCLLLCRHCRCLFWRSFGHPCIKNDEIQEPSKGCKKDDVIMQANNNIADSHDRSNYRSAAGPGFNNYEARGRISVAMLSRNFDRQAQELPLGAANVENLAPNGDNVQPSSVSNPARQRAGQPRAALGDLIGGNREQHNVERQQQQQASSRGRPEELVPKHVTITPQAFLKFFSL